MTIQDRITVSAADMIQDLEQNLDRLRVFQYDSRYRSLLGGTLIDHMEKWDRQIRSRKKDPFTIVVAGEFKRGKSSLINALVGEEVMITDVIPETVTMNRLNYGAHKNEAVLSGGRRMVLRDDELSRSSLEKLMAETGETIRQLEMWRPYDLLQDIRIVDTPGLNDVTDDRLDQIVAEAMAQADAVIYVYSLGSPLSRSEQMYIRYAILPQQYTKLFLVGNFGDLLREHDNMEKMRESLVKKTELLLPGEDIYMVSSLDEMCRIRGEARPCPELAPELENDFGKLKQAIAELIQEKKSVILADRMQRMTRTMMEDIRADLNNIEKGMEMDGNRLEEERGKLREEEKQQSQRMADAENEIKNRVEAMKNDAVLWTETLLHRMEKEDLSRYSFQEISQYYTYYCIELLQTAIQECLELHREELLEYMSDLSDSLGKGLAGAYASGDKISFCFRLNNKTWTRGDSVTLAINCISGSRTISGLADFVGSMVRKNELEADKDKLLESIRDKYPALIQEARQRIGSQYEALQKTACGLLEDYYQDQIQRARETVEQYEESASKSEEERQQMSQAVAELEQILSGFDDAR